MLFDEIVENNQDNLFAKKERKKEKEKNSVAINLFNSPI